MDKRQISVLITDLDNTLYDWVEIWYQSFNAMFEHLLTAAQENGIARDQLIREIRSIHQKYGTSEYAFLIEELPCFQALFPGENLSSKFDAAIRSYRKARKSSLRLYDYVGETLDQIRERGTLIVAYTESMAFYTNYRLRKREKLVEQGHVEPSYVLKTSLREFLELFEFVPFSGVK